MNPYEFDVNLQPYIMLSRCAAARPLVPPPMPSHDSTARPLPHGAEEDDDDGEHLFAQLVKLSHPEQVDRDDYFDEEDGWDIPGLRSDIHVARCSKSRV